MVDRSKNLMAYNRYDTQDGHGGRREEHHAEMREESIMAIQEIVPLDLSTKRDTQI